MSDSNWDLVDEPKREKFEAAWMSGVPVAIEACLPDASTPAFVPTLEELVHIDMEFAWRGYQTQGNESTFEDAPPTVETYVERFKALASDEIILRLVEQEMRCRKRALGNVEFDDYSNRFPNLTAGIQHLKTVIEGEAARRGSAMKNMEVGEQVGRYFISDKQGEGGFGLVWRADDPKLGRTIAIKQLSGRLAQDDEHRSRFINEAKIAAKLEHPGVVPIYDVEEPDEKQPYYTMKLVRGKTLEEDVSEFHTSTKNSASGKVESRRLLSVFSSICKAMQYAHDKGVIHRDLKPQNVILGDYGETIILDWGLAKFVDEEDRETNMQAAGGNSVQVTAPGAVMGTPAYMSPEQAKGEGEHVDHRSDIYCLGVILFHILTGKLPFKGVTGEEMIANVIAGKPIQPRALDGTIAKPLEAICLRAMSFRRNERYPSVKALSDELDRYLADEPVESYEESLIERASRWARKNRTWVMAGTAALLVLTIGSVVASLLINEQRKIAISNEAKASEAKRQETLAKDSAISARKKETEAKQAAVEAADREKEQKELAQWQLSRLFIKDGLRSIDDADYTTGALWFSQSLKLSQGGDDEGVDRVRIAATLRRQIRLADLFFYDDEKYGPLQDVRFSEDEKAALILCMNRFEMRELETGKVLKSIDLGANSRIQFSKDGQSIIGLVDKSWRNPTISIWNWETEKRLDCKLNPDTEKVFYSILKFNLSDSGKQLAACVTKDLASRSPSHYLALWDLEEPGKPKVTESRARNLLCCNFSPSGDLVVTGGADHVACVWDSATAELVHEFDHVDFYEHDGEDFRQVPDVKFSPDEKYVIAASSDNVAFVWDFEKKEMIRELSHGPDRFVSSVERVELSESGELVATTDGLRSTRIWNLETGQFLGNYEDFEGKVTDVSFFKNTLLLTCSMDGFCKFWAPRSGLVIPAIRHSGGVIAAQVDSGGRRFLTACDDQTVRYWDGGTSQISPTFRKLPMVEKGLYDKFVLSEDGRYLVTSARQGSEATAQVWNADTLKQIGEDIKLPNIIGKLEFSPDGTKLLLTSTTQLKSEAPHFALVVDLASGKAISERLKHEAWITEAGFFPDGSKLFTVSHDEQAVVWNVEDSTELLRIDQKIAVNSACLVNDGQVLVTGCPDKTVHFWKVTNGERHFEPLTFDHAIKSVVVSEDSSRLLAQGYFDQNTGDVTLIDLANGKTIGEPFPQASFFAPSFRKDSKYFCVFGKGKGVVSIHQASDGQLVSAIKHRGAILGFVWHPTQDRFASASEDKTLRIWDIASGEPTTPTIRYISVPVDPHFSSDGRMLITGIPFGGVVRIWDSETGEQLAPDMVQNGWAEPIAFSKENEEIFVGGSPLTVWNMNGVSETAKSVEGLMELLCGHRVDEIGGLVPLTIDELKTRFDEHYKK